MKIVISGGSGQVGTILARAFHGEGNQVVVLSRAPYAAPWTVTKWDGATSGDWIEALDGADVVINLTGRNVNCRYTPENRRAILESRVNATRVIGEAIARVSRPPHTWLQASTATIYAHRYDAPNDELTGIVGVGEGAPQQWGFSIEVAKAWEQALEAAVVPQTRKVALRAAMMMSPDRGGIFDTLLALVRAGLGGRVGDGRQYVSWIHDVDFVRSTQWLIAHPEIEGVVNLAAPDPLPYSEFMRALREAAGMKVGLPATRWMLEIATFLLRTESELVLKSRRVVPGRLLSNGFDFEFPTWDSAAEELVRRWRAVQHHKRASSAIEATNEQ